MLIYSLGEYLWSAGPSLHSPMAGDDGINKALCRWSDWPSAFPGLFFLQFLRETMGRCCKLTTHFMVKAAEKWGCVNLPVTELVYTLLLCSAASLYPLCSANKKLEERMEEAPMQNTIDLRITSGEPPCCERVWHVKAYDWQDLHRKLKAFCSWC